MNTIRQNEQRHEDAAKRKRLQKFYEAHAVKAEAWGRVAYQGNPEFPVFPTDLTDMACGAKTRSGTPCKITATYCNGRCKFHGGWSTGPKTEEGKRRSAANRKKPTEREIEPHEDARKTVLS